MQFLINWIAIIEHNDKESSVILRVFEVTLEFQQTAATAEPSFFDLRNISLACQQGKDNNRIERSRSFERGFQVAHNHKENPE